VSQLIDIKAFLATARTGSFSAAARDIGIAPSVVTKRVTRLEHEIGSRLFVRSTRRLSLTAEGERLRPRLQLLVGELEEALSGVQPEERGLVGRLRLKAPTTVGSLFVGASIARFQKANPNLTIELVLADRSVNPLEEGFDLAMGALPTAYAHVIDVPLCAYERVLVAAPDYVARHGAPQAPTDLAEHDCLIFLPVGPSWSFETEGGPATVDVHASFSVNDSSVLLAAALEGAGVTVIPRYLARAGLADGRLVQLLPDVRSTPLWFKALVPRNKAQRAEVKALIAHLRAEFEPVPPWDR
jgi:DNA-binding transcriptional LysR family regulator